MTPADLKTLVEIMKDERTPCERDGHAYTLIGGSAGDVLYCTKCGDVKKLPAEAKKMGLK